MLTTILLLVHYRLVAEQFTVLYLKGNAEIYANDQVQKLTKGMVVNTPFRVITGEETYLVLKSDKVLNKISQNTDIQIHENDIDLNSGASVVNYLRDKARNKNQTYSVKMRSAALAIRGTTFMVFSQITGESFLAVKEGAVEFKGDESKDAMIVEKNLSAITNKLHQNLEPKSYSFTRHINWNLDPQSGNLEHGEKLNATFNKVWQEHKDMQEFQWKKYKNNEDTIWEKYKQTTSRRL